jgi:hypothetical protein
MKNELSKNQSNIIDNLIKEFTSINKVTEEIKVKGGFDVSDIVSDVKAKQDAIYERKRLTEFWKKEIAKQIALDIKKLGKALKDIGFRVEDNKTRDVRLNPTMSMDKFSVSELHVSHLTNRYSVNTFSSYECHFEFEYRMVTQTSSIHNSIDVPIGFEINLRGTHYSSGKEPRFKTIEEGFNDDKFKQWLKVQYSNATLVNV